MVQPSLLDLPVRFDSGVTLTPEDHVRLGAQIARVKAVLETGRWYTVPDLQDAIWEHFRVRDPENSLQAQIRNLRKPKHGGHTIERKREGNCWYFRLMPEGA